MSAAEESSSSDNDDEKQDREQDCFGRCGGASRCDRCGNIVCAYATEGHPEGERCDLCQEFLCAGLCCRIHKRKHRLDRLKARRAAIKKKILRAHRILKKTNRATERPVVEASSATPAPSSNATLTAS